MLPERDITGKLPAYAWPGVYPMYYLTQDGSTVCPDCANEEDTSDPATDAGINWEDASMYCDDCGKRIESAYAEEERVHCDQCQMLSINGVACHETGCPNSRKVWTDGEWQTVYECRECGTKHTDEQDYARCCEPCEDDLGDCFDAED